MYAVWKIKHRSRTWDMRHEAKMLINHKANFQWNFLVVVCSHICGLMFSMCCIMHKTDNLLMRISQHNRHSSSWFKVLGTMVMTHGKKFLWYCQDLSTRINKCSNDITFFQPLLKHLCVAIKAIHLYCCGWFITQYSAYARLSLICGKLPTKCATKYYCGH